MDVLRCVDHEGRRITVIGQVADVVNVVASGEASDPDGITLNDEMFPVVVSGWLASR